MVFGMRRLMQLLHDGSCNYQPSVVHAKMKRIVRVVFMGESGVGKSSLFHRVVRGTMAPASESTIGAAFQSLRVQRLASGELSRAPDPVEGAEPWIVELWDTAGQERYATLTPMYYRNANVIIVVHDHTEESIRRARQNIATLTIEDRTRTAIVAVWQNKSDMGPTLWMTDAHDAFRADGLCTAFVSAKTGQNVEVEFMKLVRAAINTRVKELTVSVLQQQESPPPASTSQYSCCY